MSLYVFTRCCLYYSLITEDMSSRRHNSHACNRVSITKQSCVISAFHERASSDLSITYLYQ